MKNKENIMSNSCHKI